MMDFPGRVDEVIEMFGMEDSSSRDAQVSTPCQHPLP